MTDSGLRKAVIYARISIDPSGISEAPDRQLEVCRSHCRGKGWEIVEEFVERDRSAFSKATVRTQYEAMLTRVRAGDANTVVAWKIDRVGRRVAELAKLVDEFRESGVALVCPGDGVDTSTSVGALVATIIGAIAQMESEANSQRRLVKNKTDAVRGKYVKGGHRAFGRELDGSLRAEEAEAIRVIAERVIEGDTLASQARWLNASGLRTTAGSAWNGTSVGHTLREPHLRGLRTHRGEEYRGDFSPILDEATSLRLLERLRANPVPKKGRVHLLSGLARCAKCGARMNLGQVAHPNDPTKPAFVRYQCVRQAREGNCGSVSASELSLDTYVTDRFFEQLRDLLLTGRLDYTYDDEVDREALIAQVAEAAQSQSDLGDARFVTRTVADEDYQRLWLELQGQIDTASRLLTRLDAVKRQPARDFDWFGSDPERVWAAMPDVEKRDMLRSIIREVRVSPAKTRGGNRFDKSRVEIGWQEFAVVPAWLNEGLDQGDGSPRLTEEELIQSLRRRGTVRGGVSTESTRTSGSP